MRLFLTSLFFFITTIGFGQKQFEVFFDFNKDVPTENSLVLLNDWMKTANNIEIITISGYCDSIDDNFYNKTLAFRRVSSVLELIKKSNFLIKKDLSINVIGEDFNQSNVQEKNRKVLLEYIEKNNVTIESLKDIKNDSITTIEEKIEVERTSLAAKFKKVKVGDRIAIYNIHFKFNSEYIEKVSEPLLEELLFIMELNPKMVIKIHGHICCNPNPNNTKLSYRRALKIFTYLRENGIQQNRLAYNGVGSNNPIYPIPEKTEEERIINRRVEIEIVRN